MKDQDKLKELKEKVDMDQAYEDAEAFEDLIEEESRKKQRYSVYRKSRRKPWIK